jgi:adenine-specific DNA-methyltransferase
MPPKSPNGPRKSVESLKHDAERRKNIPSAEQQSILQKEIEAPRKVYYPRNRDLDPQLVWRGKDEQDWSDLVVKAPPLYIQEKVHPKVLVDDLLRQTKEKRHEEGLLTPDLFADFNGIPKGADKTEFYLHDQNWSNRMILGDSLQVMASLAEREGLRAKVQCIYFDPPYGIKFNSNFQWSTTSRDVKDGKSDHITREPEQVKAFRDTWRDGIHSYLTYLRDRLTVARDLLTESGSIFLQIGDENVHRARALLDEVFGNANFVTEILIKKKGSQKGGTLDPVNDFILWYGKSAKSSGQIKIRPVYEVRNDAELFEDFPFVELSDGQRMRVPELEARDGRRLADDFSEFREQYPGARLFAINPLKSGGDRRQQSRDFRFQGKTFPIKPGQCWKHTVVEHDGTTPGMSRLAMANRLFPQQTDVRFVRHSPVPSIREISNWWDGFGGAPNQVYVVQTNERVIERLLLMASDPGDLVLDPTCGSGTTATVAEQWGRRWITIDTSRVALALARARIMGARYPFYLLADSREGQLKEAEVTRTAPSSQPFHGNIRHGFVYERATNVTSGSIANNAEIDVIWERWQERLEPFREKLNAALNKSWEEWEIPREADTAWPAATSKLHADWWKLRLGRQQEIDKSIAAKAESEFLYDKPYEDKRKVRVAGPFTVESLSPHRILGVGPDDELIDPLNDPIAKYGAKQSFPQMVLENLRAAGVQQAHKEDKIIFSSVVAWPGELVCGEGRYQEGEGQKRAAIFIGPEFGTVQRADLVAAAREAGDAGFDVLIACAFNYEAHTTEFTKLGRIPVLKARMNADLHMAEDLKNTGKGNLFVIFGEPDIDLLPERGGKMRVRVKGVDVFHPQTGEVRSDGPDGIACWFIDTDYNEESFFVRHAYFLGTNDPYGALRTTLKAEIDADAWATLNSDTSRPFERPRNGRIAVKVINHLGDEVMKVFNIEKS